MIDFKKKMKKRAQVRGDSPIEIYETLDRQSNAGPLRESQYKILSDWYNNRLTDSDVIVKLHTGAGKTLIGLLMLMTKMVRDSNRCVYVCPNKYLVDQVCAEATKFGIPICTIGEGSLPDGFLNCERILVTHAHKMFNGKSVFGIGNKSVPIGAIVLDDAHACLDTIRESFTIKITRSEEEGLYNDFLSMFDESLKEQREGTLWDIKNNKDYDSMMLVPYWIWNERRSDVLKILGENKESKCVTFAWQLVKDMLPKCHAHINGNEIQISPFAIPIGKFGSFTNAQQRILMSATTQDDIFFTKDLRISIEAIRSPLIDRDAKWYGEKMIIIPEMISNKFTREFVIERLSAMTYKFGVIAIVPTLKLQRSYNGPDCILIDQSNIAKELGSLKQAKCGGIRVFANRYDGIDLPDNECRILILDSMPFTTNMRDRYEENARPTNPLVNKKLAQKIEQGLGRSVRGEKDYSCIIIIGSELISFLRNKATRSYFSSQTRKQIEIGLDIVDMQKSDSKDAIEFEEIISLINQCLKRDPGWKEYYESEMDSIDYSGFDETDQYEILRIETEAESLINNDRFEEAAEVYQKLADMQDSNDNDRGWYLQNKAYCTSFFNTKESQNIQDSAFRMNDELLKPMTGIGYKKIGTINQSRTQNIVHYFQRFESFEDMMIDVNRVCEQLRFGSDANKFEAAVDELGKILGYKCQRPDKNYGTGPDNLWKIENNSYVIIECKNKVSLVNRKEISKDEAGQMNNHCAWFEKEYRDAEVLRVMIINTVHLSRQANFTHDIRIMTKEKLELLKDHLKKCMLGFKDYDLRNLSDSVIQENIKANQLDNENLSKLYTVNYKQP